MVGPKVTRNVNTELKYWAKPVPDNTITLDFTKPEEERIKAFTEMEQSRKPYPVTVHDARSHEDQLSLYKNGFQYVHHEVPELKNATTEEEIEKLLVPATEQLVKDLTGATKTIPFLARIRSKVDDGAKLENSKAPALAVHTDFVPTGAFNMLKVNLPNDSEREDLLATHRVLAINVWRPLKTVTRDPLAVLDWTSAKFERDYIKQHYIIRPGFWNDLGAVKYDEGHKWWYLSFQTPEEPVVFTQFDSEVVEEGGRCAAHTAFVDPEFVDGAARESIEIKMFCFVPK